MAIKNTQLETKRTGEVDFNEALEKLDEPVENSNKEPKNSSKSWIIMLIIGIVGVVGGIIMFILPFVLPKEALPELSFPIIPTKTEEPAFVSNLTGVALTSEAEKTAPTFCVQTPNGMDGARPQAGMHQAGVVFEAIAERGITRFAAIYQNPSSAVIGPLRSLRIYYLQWDTPFDCMIVHAGGSDDALAAVRYGGYKDLTENYSYMYRGNYANYDRLWNNLFTTGAYLLQANADFGYSGSNVTGFKRMTAKESRHARIDKGVAEKLVITEPAKADVANIIPSTTNISLAFGGWLDYNVNYVYNASTNSYDRSYANGEPHWVYDCPADNLGETIPENVCELKQMSPSVVAVIMVDEWLAEDGYHEDIAAIGSGSAYIFQNGYVVPGTWSKGSAEDQISFTDASGNAIALAPGQTFVEAVPTYGGVEY